MIYVERGSKEGIQNRTRKKNVDNRNQHIPNYHKISPSCICALSYSSVCPCGQDKRGQINNFFVYCIYISSNAVLKELTVDVTYSVYTSK